MHMACCDTWYVQQGISDLKENYTGLLKRIRSSTVTVMSWQGFGCGDSVTPIFPGHSLISLLSMSKIGSIGSRMKEQIWTDVIKMK